MSAPKKRDGGTSFAQAGDGKPIFSTIDRNVTCAVASATSVSIDADEALPLLLLRMVLPMPLL